MRLLVCLLSLFRLTTALSAADWPMYLYSPGHSSYAALETQIDPQNVANLQPAWTFHGKGFGGSATITGGVVFIGDWAGYFYALRARDGRLIWKQFVGMAATPGDASCQPAIGVNGQSVIRNGVAYVPGGDSAVYALNASTGAQLWRVPIADPASGSYIWSSMMLSGSSLFFGVASLGDCPLVRGELVRMDLSDPQTPTIKFLVAAGDIGAGLWSTPAIDEGTNTAFLTTGNGTANPAAGSWGSAFLSVDASSLNVNSSFFLPTVSQVIDDDWGSSPTLFTATDGTPLVGANGKDGVLYVLRRSDMTQVWKAQVAIACDTPQDGCGSLSTPAWDGSTLYVGAGSTGNNGTDQGSVYAFQPNGTQTWFHSLPGTVIAPVTVSNGLVFVSTQNGLVVLDATSGASLWDDGGAGTIYAQPVVSDGTLYVPYANGALLAYRISNGGQTAPPTAHTVPDVPHR